MQLVMTVLAWLGLIALALNAPTDMGNSRPTTGPTTYWENTDTQNYYCKGKGVVRCETIAGGTCFTVDLCEAYCSNHDKGAACVDMGEFIIDTFDNVKTIGPKVPVTASDDNVVARDASPQENKHYSCSQDYTSILICKYGFCSTDRYCKNGSKCTDGSLSCESSSPSAQGTKSEVRAAPIPVANATLKLVARNRGPKDSKSYVCSKDHTSVLKCMHGFCALDYYRAAGCRCIDSTVRCR